MMSFYIVAPAQVVSGGPELAHQLCAEILKRGYEAKMYYVYANISEPVNLEAPEKFLKYGTDHAKSLYEVDNPENVVIVPEGITEWAYTFKNARIVMWWMSVDNYTEKNTNDFGVLDEICCLHLVQSYYAEDFLKKNGISKDKIMTLSDYIGETYLKFIYPPQFRDNRICYNPKKGAKELAPLVEKASWITWVPLINMSEEEMVLNLQMAKAYVDFGKHPGKDRIPREAASCGCMVITNKLGSAAYFEDVPIPREYKFDFPLDYDEVNEFLKKAISEYEIRFNDFNEYREIIKNEKDKFSKDVEIFLERILK